MENEVKEPAPKYNYITPEDYLGMERLSEDKHEYLNGEVFAMAGASAAHNDIAYNINRIIAPFLHGKSCKIYGRDFRIYVREHSLFTYPDFSIVCGKTETSEIFTDNLTNPSAIIEILSRTSRDYDRGTKFRFYRSIPTLQEYILVDSLGYLVEVYTRQVNGIWHFSEFRELENSFFLSTIGLQIRLNDLYDDVHPGE